MNKTNKEVATQTVLTVDELKKMGDLLADTRELIELYNHALNFVPRVESLKEGEIVVNYHSLYELTRTMFYKNQQIMRDINDVSYALAEMMMQLKSRTRERDLTRKGKQMNNRDAKMIDRVKEVYRALKTDADFKDFSDNDLMDHALKIVLTTTLQESSLRSISE